MSSKNVLWLNHFVPYPAKGGLLIRTQGLLEQVVKEHDVTLVCLVQPRLLQPYFSSIEEGLQEAKSYYEKLGAKIHFVTLPAEKKAWRRKLVLLTSLFSRNPYSVNWLKSREFTLFLEKHLKLADFDYVHVDTMGLLVNIPASIDSAKVVINHHNAEHTMMARRAQKESNFFKKNYLMLEAKKIAAYDRQKMQHLKQHIVCSENDGKSLTSLESSIDYYVVPNGVKYIEYVERSPVLGRLLFVGGLDWYPNHDAIMFLLTRVCPLLADIDDKIQIDIVGKNPSAEVLECAKKYNFVKIHGYVDNIERLYSQAQAFLCPLRDGGGTKLKVLDAMSRGLPVIGTDIAFEGINISDKQNAFKAETSEEIAKIVRQLLESSALSESIGQEARKLIKKEYNSYEISRNYSRRIANSTKEVL